MLFSENIKIIRQKSPFSAGMIESGSQPKTTSNDKKVIDGFMLKSCSVYRKFNKLIWVELISHKHFVYTSL